MTPPGERALNPILRGAAVLIAHAAAGPAIGGALLFGCAYSVLMLLGVYPSTETDGTGTPAAFNVARLATSAVAMGYAFGGPQAVMTGMWAAHAAFRKGTYSRRGAMIAAVVATALWIALLYSPASPLAEGNAGDENKIANGAKIALFLTPLSMVSALVVRWLCVRLGILAERPARTNQD